MSTASKGNAAVRRQVLLIVGASLLPTLVLLFAGAFAGQPAQQWIRLAALATDVFTYLHLPTIAGIIGAALGVELAMSHLEEQRVGTLGGWALSAGAA